MSGYGPPRGPYQGQPQDPWQQGGQPDPYGEQSWGQPDPRQGGGGGYDRDQGTYGGQGGGYGNQGYNNQGGYGNQGYDQGYDDRRGYGDDRHGYDDGYGGRTGAYPPPPPQNNYPPPGGYQPYGDDVPGYGDEPRWGEPSEPPRKKRSGGAVALAVFIALLLVGGGAAGVYFLKFKGDDKPTTPAAGPSKGASAPAAGGNGTSGAPSTAPSKGILPGDAASVKVGECLKNNGTDTAPKMDKVACGPGTYEVLKRITGTTDKNKCEGTKDYSHNYFYDSPNDQQDFVLCLKART